MRLICLLAALLAMTACGPRPPHFVPVPPPPIGDLAPLASKPISPTPPTPPTPRSDPGPHDLIPPPPIEPPNREAAIDAVNGRLRDIYFAYDRFEIASDSIETLRTDAELLRAILRDFPNLRITVEGHCDDRGSAEYNLGLGDRRAMAAVKFLHDLGITILSPVSYGKERPVCLEAAESCWRLNRRVHIEVSVQISE